MNKIKQWLESEEKDFEEGIALLRKYSRNRALVNNLSRKQNAANLAKLEYEIGKLEVTEEEPGDETIQNVSDAAPAQVIANESGSTLDEEPGAPVDPLAELTAEMQKLFTERCQLSNSLADCVSDGERRRAASEILAKQEAYNQLAIKKSFFEEHGKFPETAPAANPGEATQDKAELIGLRDNLRSQRSKARAALAKSPDDVTKQEKLAKIEIELQSVEAKIKFLS